MYKIEIKAADELSITDNLYESGHIGCCGFKSRNGNFKILPHNCRCLLARKKKIKWN
jgi:hypothetical protein